MLEEARKKKRGPLTILVTGKTGTGKSALINGLVGEQVAREGAGLKGVTREVEEFKFEKNGIPFSVFDSPGLQDAKVDDADTLKQISDRLVDKCGAEVDLLIYCLNMTTIRIDNTDVLAIKHLTHGFSAKLWKNAVFVLTFANDVKIQDEASFKERLAEFESVIKEYVREQIRQLKEDGNLVDTIPVVPAGYWCATSRKPNPWELPDRKDWFNVFWVTCANRMNEVSGICLVLSQGNRLKPASQASLDKPASQASQDKPESDCGVRAIHERSIYIDHGDWAKFLAVEGLGAGVGGMLGSSGFTGAVTVVFSGIKVVSYPFAVAGGPPGIIFGGILGAIIAYMIYHDVATICKKSNSF